MVCARCGEPLGIGRARRIGSGIRRRGQEGGNRLSLPRRWRLWLLLGGLLTVSTLLATLPQRPVRLPERPGFDATRGAALPGTSAPGGFEPVAIR